MIRLCLILIGCMTIAGCGIRTPVPDPVPTPQPVPIPTLPNGQANFWYSQSQYETLKNLHDMNPSRFNPDQLKLNGKQYTECNHNSAPVGRFNDYTLIGVGPANTCTKNSGEWE